MASPWVTVVIIGRLTVTCIVVVPIYAGNPSPSALDAQCTAVSQGADATQNAPPCAIVRMEPILKTIDPTHALSEEWPGGRSQSGQ